MTRDEEIRLNYELWAKDNSKNMFQYMAGKAWSLPDSLSIPDERMFTFPVWSTWAQYKVHINESVIIGFARWPFLSSIKHWLVKGNFSGTLSAMGSIIAILRLMTNGRVVMVMPSLILTSFLTPRGWWQRSTRWVWGPLYGSTPSSTRSANHMMRWADDVSWGIENWGPLIGQWSIPGSLHQRHC